MNKINNKILTSFGNKLFITGEASIDTYLGTNKQIIGVQKLWIKKFEFGGSDSLENNNQGMENPDLKLEDATNNIGKINYLLEILIISNFSINFVWITT